MPDAECVRAAHAGSHQVSVLQWKEDKISRYLLLDLDQDIAFALCALSLAALSHTGAQLTERVDGVRRLQGRLCMARLHTIILQL